jgi:hypothetical protein
MIERIGNMFEDFNSKINYLITTNSIVGKGGKLIVTAPPPKGGGFQGQVPESSVQDSKCF